MERPDLVGLTNFGKTRLLDAPAGGSAPVVDGDLPEIGFTV